MAKPYSPGELMRMALKAGGPMPLDLVRVLATYADPDNWTKVAAKDSNGKMRNYWSWAGPTIVGYELAQHGVKDAARGGKPLHEYEDESGARLFPCLPSEDV